MEPRIEWSPAAIQMFKDVVANAEQLVFRTKYVEEGRCFGQLFVTMRGELRNVSQMLIEMNEAIETNDYLYGMVDSIIYFLVLDRFFDYTHISIPFLIA